MRQEITSSRPLAKAMRALYGKASVFPRLFDFHLPMYLCITSSLARKLLKPLMLLFTGNILEQVLRLNIVQLGAAYDMGRVMS